MSLLREFKEFVARGNVMDLAVAVILGAAFGKIVSSLVDEVLMPPIGLALGGVDFANLFVPLGGGAYATLAEAKAAGAPVIAYGAFLNTVIQFLIVALVVFLLVKQVNRLRRPASAAAPTTRDCPYCATAIPIRATRCPACTSQLAAA